MHLLDRNNCRPRLQHEEKENFPTHFQFCLQTCNSFCQDYNNTATRVEMFDKIKILYVLMRKKLRICFTAFVLYRLSDRNASLGNKST
jgi:hypothetical protein